ncbi:Putative signal transducing protein [Hydrobacter penzbergensis]|jgi:hypothetical protein|uniref:Signal transducing protein n=1 Tax=Hydrobacter penzbergensis TaxID=1235997 RepID=A0A8X8IHV2_9BACT|nr:MULTISPECIES: DUF2007 domain-containing protein [Chitinophagaceae]MBN8719476.1 DUF2007 domain-containing protein [Sediminibacterium magnilacihabitans]PQV60518.1 putative signal transducing protein [Sediminibacterium magnilacihabitans]SDX48383.1 Putative signal transducing protein [Hydrobacter penzbergensis]
MKAWKKILTRTSYAEASIIQGVLEENEVPVQLLNKQDSSYPMFGYIEIYVPEHLVETAKKLLEKSMLN